MYKVGVILCKLGHTHDYILSGRPRWLPWRQQGNTRQGTIEVSELNISKKILCSYLIAIYFIYVYV